MCLRERGARAEALVKVEFSSPPNSQPREVKFFHTIFYFLLDTGGSQEVPVSGGDIMIYETVDFNPLKPKKANINCVADSTESRILLSPTLEPIQGTIK